MLDHIEAYRAMSRQPLPAVEPADEVVQPPSSSPQLPTADGKPPQRLHRPTHRGGRKHKRSKETLDIFYGNVTFLSEKAVGYLGGLPSDIFIAAETHALSQNFGASTRQLIKQWKTTVAEPTVSADTDSYKGNWGGVFWVRSDPTSPPRPPQGWR